MRYWFVEIFFGYMYKEAGMNHRTIAERVIGQFLGVSDEQIMQDNAAHYMRTTQCFDRVFWKGQGSFIWDRQGRGYIDLFSRVGSTPLGHNHPALVSTLLEYIKGFGISDPVPHQDAINPFATAFAKALVGLMPKSHEWQAFFCLSGTEAVEGALKICQDYWYRKDVTGRTKLLVPQNAFNGRSLGSLSANFYPLHRDGYTTAFEAFRIPYPASHPYFSRYPEGWFNLSATSPEEYEKTYLASLEPYANEILAFVVEDGVQGEGGMNVRNPDIMRRILQWCRNREILVILDAVQSGMGRTGKMFAFEHDGFAPDVLALGKAVCGGIPHGAAISRKEIAFEENGRHSNTNGGWGPACALGLAQLEVFEEEKVLEKVARVTQQIILPGLRDLSLVYPDVVHNTRMLGYMGGVEFWDAKTGEADPKFREAVVRRGLDRGLALLGCGASGIRFMPPLNTSPELISHAITLLGEVIAETRRELR